MHLFHLIMKVRNRLGTLGTVSEVPSRYLILISLSCICRDQGCLTYGYVLRYALPYP